MSNVKQETVSGAKWLLLEKVTMQPLQFLYSMVLARLITPEEMGIVGLTAVFFALATTLASAGFGSALIRKIERTDIDCDTAFWFNLGMSALLSGALFFAAPWFVQFYNQEELLWLTRCSALMMLLSSTAGIHWTLYSAERNFKVRAIIQSAATLMSMPICLLCAYMGLGVWALMIGSIVSSMVSLIWVWVVSPWKPRFRFSIASFNDLFAFGSKLTVAALISTIYNHLRTFIVGKFYSPADLGMYSKGDRLAMVYPTTITGILGTVTYPILSTLQNDKSRLTDIYRKYIKVSTLPIAWGCMLIAALAEPIVGFCFGDRWLPCVIFVQLSSIAMMFDHVSVINLNLLYVLGRSDLVLRLEIIKKTICVAMVLYAATISVTAMCAVSVIYGQIAILLNTYYTGKMIGLTWWKQQKDYWPYIVISALSMIPSYVVTGLDWPYIVMLVIGGGSSAIIYFTILIIKKDKSLLEYLPIIEKKIHHRWIKIISNYIRN